MRLAERRTHFYLGSWEGKHEVVSEMKRMRKRGLFSGKGKLIEESSKLGDLDYLRTRLRPLYQLFEHSGSGQITGICLEELLGFLGVGNIEKEVAAVQDATVSADQYHTDFEGFCQWYRNYFGQLEYPTQDLITTARYRANKMVWILQATPARKSILRRFCVSMRKRALHLISKQSHRSSASYTCLGCRSSFLLYREFIGHFKPTGSANDPSSYTLSNIMPCPVTGEIGFIDVGYLKDRCRYDFQRQVQQEFMRAVEEFECLALQIHRAEAKQLTVFSTPRTRLEISSVIKAYKLQHPEVIQWPSMVALRKKVHEQRARSAESLRKIKAWRPPLPSRENFRLPSVRGFQSQARLLCFRMKDSAKPEDGGERARRSSVRFSIPQLPKLPSAQATLPKLAPPRAPGYYATSLWTYRSRRPCRQEIVQAVVSILDHQGSVHVRDLEELVDLLKLEYEGGEEATEALVSVLDKTGSGYFAFNDFYEWYCQYVRSEGKNRFFLRRAEVPEYVVRSLYIRRRKMKAALDALHKFREVRR